MAEPVPFWTSWTTTTRDRILLFRGAISTGFFEFSAVILLMQFFCVIWKGVGSVKSLGREKCSPNSMTIHDRLFAVPFWRPLLDFAEFFSGKKEAHKHKLVCPVGLGTTPGQTRAFSFFYTVEALPGTNPVCPWDNPGDEGRHRKFMWEKFMCLFRSLFSFP